MNERANELLGEIVQLASTAIVADREDMKRQALADIADAIAKVLPAERTASGTENPKQTMDFGRFHVTRAAIPGKTVIVFRRKDEKGDGANGPVPGRIIVADVCKKDVGADKLVNHFTVKDYRPGEFAKTLYSGDSWVSWSKTEKMVYKMVKTDLKETKRRNIVRKRRHAAEAIAECQALEAKKPEVA